MTERLLMAVLIVLLASGVLASLRRAHGRRVAGLVGPAGQPRLLYFRSDDCAACVTQTSILQQLEGAWSGRVAIQKIDAEREWEQASRYGIFTLPTTLVVDSSGRVRHINYGLADADKLARQLETIG